MKQGCFAFLLVFLIGLGLGPVAAQDNVQTAATVYSVADIAVDVTAASAAKARDLAIFEAQRTGLNQLLERLGTDPALAATLSNDDIATLVQNFEVHGERTSSVRYIGIFTVQFRPLAMQRFLGSHNATFNDSQGQPVLIIPVSKNGDKVILWEEPTPWQKAWLEASHNGGAVPLIIPTGTSDDRTILSTADAAEGKVDAIKAMIEKYETNDAIVVTWTGSTDNTAAGFSFDAQHFSTGFDDGSTIEHFTVGGSPDKNAADIMLINGVKQIRHMIEKEWKSGRKSSAAPAASIAEGVPVTVWSDEAPPRLQVVVSFSTLPQWTDIQRRMRAAGVTRMDVFAVERGQAVVNLSFAEKLEDLQSSLAQHGLRLNQDVLSGEWVVKAF